MLNQTHILFFNDWPVNGIFNRKLYTSAETGCINFRPHSVALVFSYRTVKNKGNIIISNVKIMRFWIFKFGLTRKYTKLCNNSVVRDICMILHYWAAENWAGEKIMNDITHHTVWVWYAQSQHLLSHIWRWKKNLSIEEWSCDVSDTVVSVSLRWMCFLLLLHTISPLAVLLFVSLWLSGILMEPHMSMVPRVHTEASPNHYFSLC